MLSFEQFQTSRKHVDDIQEAVGFDDDQGKRSGYVYDLGCYIEDHKDGYYLIIERADYLSADLAELERILYRDWYVHEAAASRTLNTDDFSLDKFIQDYCPKHDIEIDGDVFGMMFGGIKTYFTEAEAIVIIEDAARIYGLRKG
jgi:hypothetical protein